MKKANKKVKLKKKQPKRKKIEGFERAFGI